MIPNSSASRPSHAPRLEDLRPGERVLLEELVEVLAVVVEADPDDFEPLAPIFLVELGQLGAGPA